MTIYLVLSAFTSRPISLLASVFFSRACGVFRHTQTKRKLSNNNSEYNIQSIIQQHKPPLYLGQLGKVGLYENTENVFGILAEILLGIRRFGRRRICQSYTNTDVMKLAWIKLAYPQPDFHIRVLNLAALL
jgi:hypothetical protein